MSLDVIGAGLGRTGTTSLKLALERLGFAPCHHMTEVLRYPETAGLWEAAAEGNADLESLLAGYRAAVDWPSCHFYRELSRIYPHAKVILTVRDPDGWFRSTQATIFRPEHVALLDKRPMGGFLKKVVFPAFDGRLHDREQAIAVYERHNAEVRRTIVPERLLVYDVAQGWEPLCRFLGAPIPAESFPHANTTEEFRSRSRQAIPGTGR